MWILSGVFFSATRFPAVIQPFVRALPLTAAIEALRGNMLQGTDLRQMPLQIAIIIAMVGVVKFAIDRTIKMVANPFAREAPRPRSRAQFAAH